MKRLSVLLFVTVVTLAMSGCSRPWSCWMFRGARCDTCTSGPVLDGSYLGTPANLPEPIN
jgi:hypothetical protein